MVEVMMVTALLAIIISLATPAYRGFTLRSHRTEAISSLLQAAGCQERVNAITSAYDTRQCLPEMSERYGYRFEPPGQVTPAFRILAEPRASQSTDTCGAIILDQDGYRSVGNGDADTGKCWAGR